MDEFPRGACLASATSPAELGERLAANGIPVHLWGVGEAKRVEDLWSELRAGESVLTGSPLRRQVSFVAVLIRRGDTTLTEVGQVLASGHTRPRRWPPGEKLLPGEDVETAALRCVEEELGVPRESCRIVPGTRGDGARTGESASYPGLVTHYRMHEVELEVPGLPETAFSTTESAEGDSAVTTHHWDWT